MRLLVALLVALATPVAAQQRLTADTDVRAAPSGNTVATLNGGTSWPTGETQSGWTVLTIRGWVEASRFAGPRDSFPQHIGGDNTLRIREEPSLNGRILGEFRGGAGVQILERRANWARIQREVWAPASALAPLRGAAASAATRATASSGAQPPAASRDSAGTGAAGTTAGAQGTPALKASAAVPLLAAPGGAPVGELASGSVVVPQARDRGWVKVQVEAWVPESLFVPADSGYRAELTAADVRLDPAGVKGRIVRWEVQVVGLQYADPLRKDLAPEEPFLLAVGPKGEDAILYVAVPPSLLAEAKAIPPMTPVMLTARIRSGRSQPTGAPVLEMQSVVRLSDK